MSRKPKICAYVQDSYAKQTYKNECMDVRQFVGLRVIIDVLERAGYPVEWAGRATVHNYDFVLVSLTADCDWFPFIQERLTWRKGPYKVIVGGAGLLHISPFLPFFDVAIWGRGEDVIVPVINGDIPNSAAETAHFDENKEYYIAQAKELYPHEVALAKGRKFCEDAIGCNHKCLFCGYSWHRKFMSNVGYYAMSSSMFEMKDVERAILDMEKDYSGINFRRLRTTAIDGFSERLRRMVNKPITRAQLIGFFHALHDSIYSGKSKPYQLKLYNICGYPTETTEDRLEFVETLKEADMTRPALAASQSILLQCTPFNPVPATPMACAPVSYRDYRTTLAQELKNGVNYKGNIIYRGKSFWSVLGGCLDSLATVSLRTIAARAGRADTEAITRLCSTPKFWRANTATKQATLERYFDLPRLFGAYTRDTLPSRYLRTYLPVHKGWPKNADYYDKISTTAGATD